MKNSVLLVDESLTVQKVVSLTLDRSRFRVDFAKSRSEAMKYTMDRPPDVILVSDQVPGIVVAQFPSDVRAWVGPDRVCPPIILISSQEMTSEQTEQYQRVLRKPFSPQGLQSIVEESMMQSSDTSQQSQRNQSNAETGTSGGIITGDRDEHEEGRLQKIFHETFPDEADLVRQTFQGEIEEEEATLVTQRPATPGQRTARPELANELWGPSPESRKPASSGATSGSQAMAEDSPAFRAALDHQISRFLERQNLEEVLGRVLEKLIPPLVEKMAQERLDKLLSEDVASGSR